MFAPGNRRTSVIIPSHSVNPMSLQFLYESSRNPPRNTRGNSLTLDIRSSIFIRLPPAVAVFLLAPRERSISPTEQRQTSTSIRPCTYQSPIAFVRPGSRPERSMYFCQKRFAADAAPTRYRWQTIVQLAQAFPLFAGCRTDSVWPESAPMLRAPRTRNGLEIASDRRTSSARRMLDQLPKLPVANTIVDK